MKNFNAKLIWGIYITGMLININNFYFSHNYHLIKLAIGSAIMLVAIILIIKDIWKSSSQNKWPWSLFIFFMSGIAIPIYLLIRKEPAVT